MGWILDVRPVYPAVKANGESRRFVGGGEMARVACKATIVESNMLNSQE